MKIGIISDVHGDIEHLELALDFFARQKVDMVVCAGDLVDKGSDADAVVKRVRDEAILTVQGNHDYDPFEPYQLSSASKDFLEDLPELLDFDWEGRTVQVAHGAPWDSWEYVYSSDDDVLLEVAEAAETDIVILGHTHIPMIANIHNGACWILNPGSVCSICHNIYPTCAILTIPPDEKLPIHFEVYDLTTDQTVEPERVRIQ